jgi:hypothetical protein
LTAAMPAPYACPNPCLTAIEGNRLPAKGSPLDIRTHAAQGCRASDPPHTLNLSEKLRLFVFCVCCRQCWIHLSLLPEFAGPFQVACRGALGNRVQDAPSVRHIASKNQTCHRSVFRR